MFAQKHFPKPKPRIVLERLGRTLLGLCCCLTAEITIASDMLQSCLPIANGSDPILITNSELPYITGNLKADNRIRFLAKQAGYQLQPLLLSPDDLSFPDSIHYCVVPHWTALRHHALENNVNISVVSGYRSIERQRQIFRYKLKQRSIQDEDIAQERVDYQIRSILEFSAIPGFSRHHSGFVIDIQSNKKGLSAFGQSDAYKWLASDRFKIARKFGFVPSYPTERPGQGPSPESWEFMWVGKALAQIDSHFRFIEDTPSQRLLHAATQNLLALDQQSVKPTPRGDKDPFSISKLGSEYAPNHP